MKHGDKEPNLGSAVLGMYAAIKICRAAKIPWEELGKLVEPVAIENEKRENSQQANQ